MHYFKNVQLAKLYHVSEKAVRNWIEAAHAGRLDLTLYEQDGRLHIANTTKNKLLVEELAEKGRKSRNLRYHRKVLKPSPQFYELYSTKQVLDIISNLDIHQEIPLQYGYFNGGAEFWDKYISKLHAEPTLNNLRATTKLLNLAQGYIDDLLSDYERINIIDLGPGNGLPAKGLLTHLLERNALGRYIAIDLSEAMLSLVQRNIKTWFGDRVPFEAHARDMRDNRFDDLLVDADDTTANIVLLFGSTLSNHRLPSEALQVTRKSMGKHDLLLYTMKLDTANTRQYFDLGVGEQLLAPNMRLVIDLLSLDSSLYEVEQFFNESLRARIIRVRLNVDVSIQFDLEGRQRTIDFNKGDTILVWRSWQQSGGDVTSQLIANDFRVLHTSKTRDHEYLFVVAEVTTGQ